MDNKKIGLFIAQERKAKQLTQVDFAENAGISPSIYAKWESGSRRPSRKMYQQLKVIYPEI